MQLLSSQSATGNNPSSTTENVALPRTDDTLDGLIIIIVSCLHSPLSIWFAIVTVTVTVTESNLMANNLSSFAFY